MTNKEKQFVSWVKSECKKANVEVSLRSVSFVKAGVGIKCSGYFEERVDDVPRLVSSLNRKDWVEILAHEFSHMRQWQEKMPLWVDSSESFELMDKWLAGGLVYDIKKHLGVVRDLELDCEKRAVKLIKEWNLNVDIENYIRKANAYVHFYNYIYKTRKWSDPNNSPYGNPNVISVMSPTFRMNYKKMSKKVEKAFLEERI